MSKWSYRAKEVYVTKSQIRNKTNGMLQKEMQTPSKNKRIPATLQMHNGEAIWWRVVQNIRVRAGTELELRGREAAAGDW